MMQKYLINSLDFNTDQSFKKTYTISRFAEINKYIPLFFLLKLNNFDGFALDFVC